jgi:hypothetical protein
MKKSLVIFVALGLVIIFNIPAQSKQPKYKALFNLTSDPRYYKYVEYKSPHHSDNDLLLKIVDKRPEQEKSYNEDVQYFYDDIWTEPPGKMLGKIILKELRFSNIFREVNFEEAKASMILEIELISLVGHYDDKSRVAKGIVKMRPVLKWALDNRIILDRNYEETSSSIAGRFTNAYRPMVIHIGRSLNTVLGDMMKDLENKLLKESRK